MHISALRRPISSAGVAALTIAVAGACTNSMQTFGPPTSNPARLPATAGNLPVSTSYSPPSSSPVGTTDLVPQRVVLHAVTASDETRIIAVGGTDDVAGTLVLVQSDDGGTSWSTSQVSMPALSTVAVAGVNIFGAVDCAARVLGQVPPDSCLMRSDDDGFSWSAVPVGRVVDPTFSDATHGWTHTPVGEEPSLYATDDGGQTWQSIGSPCTSDKPLIEAASISSPGAGYVLCLGKPKGDRQQWALIRRLADGTTSDLLDGESSGDSAPNLEGQYPQGLAMRDGDGLLWTNQQLYRSQDSGTTWMPLALTDPPGASVLGRGVLLPNDVGFLIAGRTGIETSIFKLGDGALHPLITWPYFGGPPSNL